MHFHEKVLMLRKKNNLSQEELGLELGVSRQTISKWEAGLSYPDFQRLVMLSDFFDIPLDELVKDIDVQDIRNKSLTDEKIASLFTDSEKLKNIFTYICKGVLYLAIFILVIGLFAFAFHWFYPDSPFFWNKY